MTRLYAHPEPILVGADPGGAPVTLFWGGQWREVRHIANRWRVTTSWWNWEAFASREYVKLITADGLLCTVYRDMTDDAWYVNRIYD